MGRKKIQKRRDAGAANLKAYDQAVGATAIGPCSWNLGGSNTKQGDDQISDEELKAFASAHGALFAELSGVLQGICDARDRVSLVLFVRALGMLSGKAIQFYDKNFK